jgi:hypothetical protein
MRLMRWMMTGAARRAIPPATNAGLKKCDPSQASILSFRLLRERKASSGKRKARQMPRLSSLAFRFQPSTFQLAPRFDLVPRPPPGNALFRGSASTSLTHSPTSSLPLDSRPFVKFMVLSSLLSSPRLRGEPLRRPQPVSISRHECHRSHAVFRIPSRCVR